MARVGIIGTGWGARVQVPAFRQAGLDVAAICGRDPGRTAKIGRELEVEVVDDWRDLIDRKKIDLISIVTPPSHHREMAIGALEAGRHVLCEKPTALNADEAESMLAAALQRSSQLSLVDHELRFLPSWRAARDLVAQIAPVRYVEVRYSSPSRGDRKREWNWWSDADEGGGVLGAVGSHFIDATRYLVDEIVAVRADLHTFVAERPFEEGVEAVTSDDFAAFSLQLRGGSRAVMQFSVVSAVDEPTSLSIHGEEGGLRLVGDELWTAKRGGEWSLQVRSTRRRITGDSAGGVFGTATLYLAEALVHALDQGEMDELSPAATFEDGLAQQRVLDAARRSAREEGRWIRIEA